MHFLSTEYRFVSFQILLKETIHKLISFRIEQVEVIHAIFFAADLRFIMCKGKSMCRSIDLGNDLYIKILGQLLQVDKFTFSVISVFGSQSGIRIRLQTERSISLRPIMFKVLFKAIIIQVNLQSIHLVISHDLHIVLKESKRNKLTSAVYHEATHGIVGKIAQSSFRELVVFTLFRDLEQSTGSPIYAYTFGSSQQDTVGYFYRITFFTQLFICADGKDHVAGSAFALYHFGFIAEHCFTIIGQHTGYAQQFRLIGGTDNLCSFGRHKRSFGTFPLFQFGNHKRFGINNCTDAGTNQA